MSTFYSLFLYKNNLNYLNYIRNLCPLFLKNINFISYLQIWNLKNSFISISALSFFLENLSTIFKKHQNFLFYSLVDVSCIDFVSKKLRYSINYNLFSFIYNFRLFLKVVIEEWSSISSLSSNYCSATWLEREVWDMYGVFFLGNMDLRRILTDYGFKYFPLRKDFPLSGFLEVRYDDFLKSLVYEPVEFSQEYRRFEFKNTW